MKKTFLCFMIMALLSFTSMLVQAQSSQRVKSYLEVINVKTMERTLVHEFDSHIEAPNWTPDGKYLVYNSGGKLYKIPADGSGDAVLINTGNATRLNNDHVLTFDGSFFGLSGSGENGLTIWTVPYEGGSSKEVASGYLHGISPDNKTLAYVASRGADRNMDIYIKNIDGGDEVRLTTAEGLDDGPEYSRDGKYIWFNSVRSGLMQVWRMKADGSEQTQMTFLDSNNWFPHMSPNNKLICFISYNKDEVEPGSHPANKNVKLYLMDKKAKKQPKVLVELFGGQGTINVNSWAPDSKRFAFVRYELVND